MATIAELQAQTQESELQPGEENNDVGNVQSILAGLASGLIKIPEGFVSLGATLIDLGADYAERRDFPAFCITGKGHDKTTLPRQICSDTLRPTAHGIAGHGGGKLAGRPAPERRVVTAY